MDLPTYPPKGQRRLLDQLWLTKLEEECRGTLLGCIPKRPPELKLAVTQFNQRQYWQCHETLEEIWMLEEYPLRLFYHGLIKAAVGLYHLERNNKRGASLKLKDAERTLAQFMPKMMGIDVGSLVADVKERLELMDSDQDAMQGALHSLPAIKIRKMQSIQNPSTAS